MKSRVPGPFTVTSAKAARKYIDKTEYLQKKWPDIERALIENPYPVGTGNPAHLRATWHCNYRWEEGNYRLMYTIDEEAVAVGVFYAGPRGDAYKKKG